ncbi:MAG: ECF transporter S component [Gracilibacteraceae bacterium]|jgi:energy-coupling factor transport system substrate-specific component|nr:ECF transporter S component [Gracilibacteraceae bacterium]
MSWGNLVLPPPLLAVGLIAAFLIFYERRRIVIEKTVLIALLTALATIGRLLFAMIGSVQAASFIIIAAGMSLGPEIGCMVGLMTGAASNLVLGLGPWAPWQMLAWGLMGGAAGFLHRPLLAWKTLRVAYGFIWGFLFGWLMNLWFVAAGYADSAGWSAYWPACVASLPFDAAHAVTNAALLLWAGDGLAGSLHRVARRYGLKA